MKGVQGVTMVSPPCMYFLVVAGVDLSSKILIPKK